MLNLTNSNSLCRFMRRGVFALAVLLCLSAGLLFTGCPVEPEEEGGLNGTWVNVYKDPTGEFPDFVTTIKINTSASPRTIVYEGSYEGKIVNQPDFTAANGVLIIEFTKYCDFMDPAGPVATHANVGKFGALYWRDLTSGSVKMADAYTGGGMVHAMENTLAEAQANFTDDRVDTYVPWGITSAYSKQ